MLSPWNAPRAHLLEGESSDLLAEPALQEGIIYNLIKVPIAMSAPL
jgi:hypothetical protein